MRAQRRRLSIHEFWVGSGGEVIDRDGRPEGERKYNGREGSLEVSRPIDDGSERRAAGRGWAQRMSTDRATACRNL
jgi:hypothetical protein